MKLLSALALLLLLALPSRAQVLIYKGTYKVTVAAPPSPDFPKLATIYFLIQPGATPQYSDVGYFTKNGKHLLFDDPTAIYIASADALGGKTLTALTIGTSTFTDATHFQSQTLLLSGVNSTLNIATTGVPQTMNFPKSLTGVFPIVENSGGNASIIQIQLVLSFQMKATIDANNAAKTISEVETDLITKLKSEGYK